MGKEYLVDGAKLVCVCGNKPGELIIPRSHNYISKERKKANCKDCKAGDNISYFGKCKLGEATCLCSNFMMLEDTWKKIDESGAIAETVESYEAITMDNVLLCKRGGIIIPITSGQGFKKGIDKNVLKGLRRFLRWMLGFDPLYNEYGGDPINLNTGNFIYQKEDLKINGILHMCFQIFYNSLDQDKGGCIGEGWHHNYEIYIREKDGGKQIHICLSDGREIPYRLAPGNTYLSVFGDKGELKKEGKRFCYCESGGLKYSFNDFGKLTVREDKNGNRDILSYNEKGQLIQVKSSNGGEYFYSYNAEGYMIGVCDHVGRKVHLRYRYGKLYQYVDACGYVYTYTYNENGKLDSITAPTGIVSVKNIYDSVNRVQKQELSDGGIIELFYDDENRKTYMREQNKNMMIYESDEYFRNIKTIYEDGEEVFGYNDKNQRTFFIDKNGNQTSYSYDGNGNMTGVRDALGRQRDFVYDEEGRLLAECMEGRTLRRNSYDERGRLIKTEDALGRSKEILYNKRGQPEQIIKADGSFLYITYDGKGNILSVKNSYGIIVRYEYDNLNRVKAVINGEGNRIQYEYDEKNHLLKIIHPDGNFRSYIYNEKGKPVQIQDFDGEMLSIKYNIRGLPEKQRDKEGRETIKIYDKMGNLEQIVSPIGTVLSYQYDKNNRIIRMELGKEDETEESKIVYAYEYDPVGNLLHMSIGDGKNVLSETYYEYDALNRLVTVTNPVGGKTSYEYDRVTGNISSITDPIGNQRTFYYNDAGELVEETDIKGNITRYEYNPLGKLCTVVDGAGRKTQHLYQPGGRLEKSIFPSGREITYEYDNIGRVSRKTYRGGYYVSYSYDKMGRLHEILSSEGQKKTYTYDALGHVVSVTDALGNTTRYAYTINGKLREVVDALGNRTEYTYNEMDKLIHMCQYGKNGEADRKEDYIRNAFGQIECVRDALGMEEIYKYDVLGRITETIDKEGYQTVYSYNSDSRIESILYGDGRQAEFSYNPLGQLSMVKDWLGETKIERNLQGEPESITDYNGQTVHYEWGKFGERIGMIYPDGTVLRYRYDDMLHLVGLERCESGREELHIAYGYDEESRLAWKRSSGGYCTKWDYNRLGQLSELIHEDDRGILDRYTYEYDLLGNKTSIHKERREMSEESGNYTYYYDNLGRLTEVKKDKTLLRKYQYDSFGNRISVIDYNQDLKSTYAYDEVNRLKEEEIIFSDGRKRKRYVYDKRGNMVGEYQEGALYHGYYFGATNRLEKAWDSIGREALYFYNGLNQRTGRKTGDLDEQYWLDLTKRYHNLLGIKTTEKRKKFYWDYNVAVMEEEERQPSYYLQDELGSPLRVLYGTGKGEVYGYNEFGKELHQSKIKSAYKKQYSEQGEKQPFGYTGYRYDNISDTYFAQAREFQPRIGRFTADDTERGDISYPYTLNRTIYCWNRPMNFVDVDGRKPKHPIEEFLTLQGDEEYENPFEEFIPHEEKKSLSESLSEFTSPIEESVTPKPKPEPEGPKNIITFSSEIGIGIGGGIEIQGIGAEAVLKVFYLGDIITEQGAQAIYGAEASLGAEVSELAEMSANWQYQYDIFNDELLVDDGDISASFFGMSVDDKDIIFSVEISEYLGIGYAYKIEFNISELLRRLDEC